MNEYLFKLIYGAIVFEAVITVILIIGISLILKSLNEPKAIKINYPTINESLLKDLITAIQINTNAQNGKELTDAIKDLKK